MSVVTPVLVLPGHGNSGPQHWQSLWELRHPDWRRVDLVEWDQPVCEDWVRVLDEAVRACSSPPLLVAHSLACLLVAQWAYRSVLVPKGAFLVALPDPQSECFPAAASGFAPMPMVRFAFRSLVVASTNDPFGSLSHAKECAIAWGSRLVDIGQAGHINTDSRHGAWDEGYSLLKEFMD
ncbi:MAG: alpha/beta hydrolase [Nitrospira sp.]|nr:serine hydrolase family protein [Nitrospira sp.]TKB73175.1 MAG: alpha/beta hydrolase [Nitrospira sp.]